LKTKFFNGFLFFGAQAAIHHAATRPPEIASIPGTMRAGERR